MLENKHENGYAGDSGGRSPEPHELVIASLDEALRVHPLYRKRVIDSFREDAANAGTNSSFKTWLNRYNDWTRPDRRHYPPPVLYTRAIEVVGHCDFLDPWLGLAAKVGRQQRIERAEAAPREHAHAL